MEGIAPKDATAIQVELKVEVGLPYLAQNGYFEDEAFIGYLKYLQYWQLLEYIKYIIYPQCLFFLELLQTASFRSAMAIHAARAAIGEASGTTVQTQH
ncbi:hypothetical protein NE237_000002 [Protea cynaroides]|uniref:Mediator of RNA polymerase II transcription subunit 31 n=1 Tax=Protea cynaroides TaxID=273540 RepID=A0A9Q0JQW9_9MAGN|nr:hypothetical protein NE237_000002 [Protea cynaroides]